MSKPHDFVQAKFTIVEGGSSSASGEPIIVQFNPTSLQHTVANTLQNTGQGAATKQYVSQSSAKLTMDLIFDTTDSGQDVRLSTSKIAQLMKATRAVSPNDRSHKVPPLVDFEWGIFKFQGMVESFKETIDFFSGNGVPLRSSVNLTMSAQDHVFDELTATDPVNLNPSFALDEIQVPTSANASATSTAAQGGNPSAARGIAAANNLDSMRFTGGASLTLSAGAQLKGAAGFSTGASAGAGAGFGLSGGAGLTAGAGASASFGSIASAGISASGGAFEGLRTSATSQASGLLNTSSFLKTNESAGISTDSGASFNVGGKATVEGSASLSADVGAKTDIRGKIQFD